MKKNRIILTAGSLILAVLGFANWMLFQVRDPLFRGKPESDWIEHLSYADDAQVKQWLEFGSEGVRVLVRGLEAANRPVDRFYRTAYRSMRTLPAECIGESDPSSPALASHGHHPKHANAHRQPFVELGERRDARRAGDGPSPQG